MAQPPAPEDARRRATAAWLRDAHADLATARVLSAHRDEDAAPFAAAFHAQQAVEKALKALLIWLAIDYPPKHDLGLLVSRLPSGAAMQDMPVAGLTVYAVEQRYVTGATDPMGLNERPTWDEADDAIATAACALTAGAADLGRAGWTDPA